MRQDTFSIETDLALMMLKRMRAKEGILFYLLCKGETEGASLGELYDVLSCAPGTFDNALRTLSRAGEVVKRGDRYYRGGKLGG